MFVNHPAGPAANLIKPPPSGPPEPRPAAGAVVFPPRGRPPPLQSPVRGRARSRSRGHLRTDCFCLQAVNQPSGDSVMSKVFRKYPCQWVTWSQYCWRWHECTLLNKMKLSVETEIQNNKLVGVISNIRFLQFSISCFGGCLLCF